MNFKPILIPDSIFSENQCIKMGISWLGFFNIDNVSIEINDGKYFLTGVDESVSATSGIKLILSSGNFYEAKFYRGGVNSSLGGYSYTYLGCTSIGSNAVGECIPKENKGGWYCKSCSQRTCTKTVT